MSTNVTKIRVKGVIYNLNGQADGISYDNSQSGLSATTVQDAIGELNIKTSNVRKINNFIIFTNEDGFYITDTEGNIGFKVDTDGNIDGINFGSNLLSIINNLISSSISSDIESLDLRISEIAEENWLSEYSIKIDSNGFYLIDANGNIGLKLDTDGTFDVMDIGSNIISLIRENIGNLGIESWSKLDAYDTTNPLRHISSEFPFVGIFHSWGFVGDSLSSGEMYGIQTPQTITLDSPVYTDKLYDKDGNLENYTGGKVYAFSIPDYTYVRVDVSSSDASTLTSNYAVICHVSNGDSTASVVSKYTSSKTAYGSTKNKGTIYVSCLGNVVVQTMTYKVEDKYEYSYGQVLCRMLGLDGYNFSKGGQTVKGFLSSTSERGLTGLLANPKQAYCVALGVNDRNTTYSDGIGTGADIDFNDSTNNQNSFVGQYGVLLQNIFSIQPQAKVFVLTPTKVSTNDPIVVGIRSVVSAFRENGYDDRVFLVDLAMYNSYVDNDELIDFTNLNGHRSALGYTYLALMVGTYINQIIRENYDVMRIAGFIGEFDSFDNPIIQDNPIKV